MLIIATLEGIKLYQLKKLTKLPHDEYPGIRDFYKKMFEMLNEQIVLKKQ